MFFFPFLSKADTFQTSLQSRNSKINQLLGKIVISAQGDQIYAFHRPFLFQKVLLGSSQSLNLLAT